MNLFDQMGRTIMMIGIVLVVIGAVTTLLGKTGIGRLPGDIVYRRGNFTFYVPLATSVLLSLLLTALFSLFRRR